MTLLHVSFGFNDKPVDVSELAKTFDVAHGWARYAPNCWVINTHESAQIWADRFRKICSENDSIYVVEINKNNQAGYLQKEIWDWFSSR